MTHPPKIPPRCCSTRHAGSAQLLRCTLNIALHISLCCYSRCCLTTSPACWTPPSWQPSPRATMVRNCSSGLSAQVDERLPECLVGLGGQILPHFMKPVAQFGSCRVPSCNQQSAIFLESHAFMACMRSTRLCLSSSSPLLTDLILPVLVPRRWHPQPVWCAQLDGG